MSRPDPKFTATGYIDVLLPTNSTKEAEFHGALGARSLRRKIPPRPPKRTFSYEEGHYDEQRVISVPFARYKNYLGFDGEKEIEKVEASSKKTSLDSELAWGKFQSYLRSYIPVKISDYVSFNPIYPAGCLWGGCCEASEVCEIVKLMPKEALGARVSAQCYLKKCTSERGGKCVVRCERFQAEEECRKKRRITLQEIDDVLTVACKGPFDKGHGKGAPSMFFGQEDQLTVQLPLADVFEPKYCKDVELYVAQETILSRKSLDKSQGNIICEADGTISLKMGNGVSFSTETKADNCNISPLRSLSRGVVAPSLLLPSDSVRINEVNLWFAPQNSCTNYHYDGHHNILCVVHGCKTIELAPPGAIKGSAIYSEHANHPAFLRASYLRNTSNENLDFELKSTKQCLNKCTVVVSVSAGEGLLIPAGWWHRVESCGPCLAVNFWFEMLHGIPQPIGRSNNHMLPFEARELLRKYFDENMDEWVLSYKKSRLQKIITRVDVGDVIDSSLNVNTCHSANSSLNVNTCNSATQVTKATRRLLHNLSLNSSLWGKTVVRLAHLISIFLLKLDYNNDEDLRTIMSMSNNGFFCDSERSLLPAVVFELDIAACFVLTQAWERQCEFEGNNSEEAEETYMNFLAKCGREEGAVRAHLATQAENFKRVAASNLIVNDLIMGDTDELSELNR